MVKQKRQFSREQIKLAITITACILVIALIGFGIWTSYSKMITAQQEKQEKINHETAQDIAGKVSHNFIAATKLLSTLAIDEDTIAIFAADDDEALLKESENKMGLFSQAHAIRYIRPKDYAFDEHLTSELSWASIELLKKASTRSNINAQAQLSKDSNTLDIVLVKSVFNSDFELIGLLHLTFGEDLFQELMDKVEPPSGGYIELMQPSHNQKIGLILAKSGNDNVRINDAIISNINKTLWVIAYWPPNHTLPNNSIFSIFNILLIVIILVLLALGAKFFVTKHQKQSTVLSDTDASTTYGGAVVSIAEGAHANVRKNIPNLPQIEKDSKKKLNIEGLKINAKKQAEIAKINAVTDTPKKK